jgi:hypothetical protein
LIINKKREISALQTRGKEKKMSRDVIIFIGKGAGR